MTAPALDTAQARRVILLRVQQTHNTLRGIATAAGPGNGRKKIGKGW